MKQKELTKTFMMISNLKKFSLHGLNKTMSAFQRLTGLFCNSATFDAGHLSPLYEAYIFF